jgi:hypothetical protein
MKVLDSPMTCVVRSMTKMWRDLPTLRKHLIDIDLKEIAK